MSTSFKPATLPELLYSRAQEASTAHVSFLDNQGAVEKKLSYADLYSDAVKTSQQLLAAGLQADKDIVVGSFHDAASHVKLFWACALAGIRFSPLPPLHPEQSRRALFFQHINNVFEGPTLVATEQTIAEVKAIAADFKTLSLAELETKPISAETQSKVFPSKRISADDVAVFMLTSGSTGNSKAVALRHSNILSSVSGKIKHHGTTSKSVFLNWIAFDHVASVTEVHIQALAANATQYHTSPAAVVQQPRNLLEWVGRLGITYTFSPNFLIAQICRDAKNSPYPLTLDLSKVQVFVSGGEAVPVKTAVEFADLLEAYGAPRDSLRAGFGMSETGAGCIYDTRAIVRGTTDVADKYLSLGDCCDGVEMRVVSRSTGKVCAPLEPGQLELKGSSVFSEYYNNPEATAESFTADGWFITGDSALLDQDGNLHLVGRDKDSININGVKHPSVDVETYIVDNGIAGVSATEVFVCPMRLPNTDTDTYAVFYQHTIPVENDLTEEELTEVVASNRAIRNAAIIFCSQAPHAVIPLPRKYFAKSAIGKVSRAGLMAAYFRGEHAALEEKLKAAAGASATGGPASEDPIEIATFEVISDLLGKPIDTLNRGDSLFDIGVSSMHLVRLKHLLQDKLNIVDVPMIDILRHPELGSLCDFMVELSKPVAEGEIVSRYSPLVCMNPHGSKPPVFLVHPGVGEVLVFVNLARVLGDDRPVWSLRARGFDVGEEPFGTFDEMVTAYATAIESKQAEGPYYVGGYSFGGAVAFEIAKKLEAKGKTVAWVGVFNLPPHIQFRMKELIWVEVLINLFMFLHLVPSNRFEAVKQDVYKIFPNTVGSDVEPANSPEIIQYLLDVSDPVRLDELQLSLQELTRWTQVAYTLSCLGRTYDPVGGLKDALMTIFCAIPLPQMGTREVFKRDRLSHWADFASHKGVEFIDVEGEHYTMIDEDHVQSFAGHMVKALTRATEQL